MIKAGYNSSIIYILNYYNITRFLDTDNSYWFADESNWYYLSLPLLQHLLTDLEIFRSVHEFSILIKLWTAYDRDWGLGYFKRTSFLKNLLAIFKHTQNARY